MLNENMNNEHPNIECVSSEEHQGCSPCTPDCVPNCSPGCGPKRTTQNHGVVREFES